MKELSAVLAIAVFLLPTVIAFVRGHASKWGIAIVNILFGITVIGWVFALIWASSNKGANQTVIINNGLKND